MRAKALVQIYLHMDCKWAAILGYPSASLPEKRCPLTVGLRASVGSTEATSD
jgi:hypothetical protein